MEWSECACQDSTNDKQFRMTRMDKSNNTNSWDEGRLRWCFIICFPADVSFLSKPQVVFTTWSKQPNHEGFLSTVFLYLFFSFTINILEWYVNLEIDWKWIQNNKNITSKFLCLLFRQYSGLGSNVEDIFPHDVVETFFGILTTSVTLTFMYR